MTAAEKLFGAASKIRDRLTRPLADGSRRSLTLLPAGKPGRAIPGVLTRRTLERGNDLDRLSLAVAVFEPTDRPLARLVSAAALQSVARATASIHLNSTHSGLASAAEANSSTSTLAHELCSRRTSMGITLEERVTFAKALWEDVDWARKALDDAPDADKAHARRALVRASFAALEGTIHGTKQWMLRARKEKDWKLSLSELACLRERSFDVDDNGTPKARQLRVKTLLNLKFVAKLAGRLATTFSADFGGTDWQALQTAVEVRNRIVHPKTAEELVLTDTDIETVERGIACARNMLKGMHDSLS